MDWKEVSVFLLIIGYVAAKCEEENVFLDGDAMSKNASRTPDDCFDACITSRCAHWTWRNGECTILRTANPGKKVGTQGAVSGTNNRTSCGVLVEGVQCHYTESRDPVVCLFPFFGEVPGSKDTSTQHETCLQSKRGKFWCATKISLTNQLLATSDQTQDVSCDLATSKQGVFRCMSSNSCPTMVSVQQRIADLEKKNRDLEAELASAGAACSLGWSKWSAWSDCSKPCKGEQTRTRTCSSAGSCQGDSSEKRNCGDACGSSTTAGSPNSCTGRCGKPAGLGQCQCTSGCSAFGDCCSDYGTQCGGQDPNSCTGRCGDRFDRKNKCQCNLDCADFKNCCQDFSNVCKTKPVVTPTKAPSPVRVAPKADPKIGQFTETLLALDENNARDKITINSGCTTRVGNPRDCSSQPLFTSVDTSIFSAPVYTKLLALYENYDPDTMKVEDNTNAEKAEENQFIDEIMKTKVMKETLNFLKTNNFFTKSETDFKKLLKELWFGIYSRGMRINGSSGFEHVFLGEKKNGKVQGFHNWVYFYYLEQKKQVNYLGHWEEVDLGGRGTGLSFTFLWGQEQKPFASMLVGTSPELEMAVYTTCLLAKGEEKCAVSLGGKEVDIEVHVFSRPGGVRYIASSFMDWA